MDRTERPMSHAVLLIRKISEGDRLASDELFPLVYNELRSIARRLMAREKEGQTLQPTALVHEAYLRLIDETGLGWENRAHFFGAAAEAMRRILIDRARRKRRIRHGGEMERITLTDELPHADSNPEAVLLLDEALGRLERLDQEMARVVKLRYFAGLTVDEAAACLGISSRSVNRHWVGARAWLQREINGSQAAARRS
jgi:RNA polymerase sigma factor (TIGR02999 family)